MNSSPKSRDFLRHCGKDKTKRVGEVKRCLDCLKNIFVYHLQGQTGLFTVWVDRKQKILQKNNDEKN